MKTKLNFLIRSILFVLIFLLILSITGPLFQPKGNAPEDGIHDHKQNSFLGEMPNSLDVVIIGNSLGQCGISPLDIWENYGITAQVCASGNQVLHQSVGFLKDVFQHHTPKVVILEAEAILQSSTLLDRIRYTIEHAFPTIRYHDRWKILQPQDFTGSISYTYTDDLKGYHYEGNTIPCTRPDKMIPTDEIAPFWEKNLDYLDEITRLCNDNDALLFIVSVPSRYSWDYAKHNRIVSLSAEYDAPYLDLNLMDIGLDWNTDTYDNGNHLNYSGAQKVSIYIGQYLQNMGLFSDKRDLPEYSSWNEALNRFRQSIPS